MPGVNDPVVFELLRKGVPNTAENYNRMAEALRVGGWTGGHQPVTGEMIRRGRSYMPMRGEEPPQVSSPEEEAAEPVDTRYLDETNEVRGAPIPQDKPPAPAPQQAASSPAPTGAAPMGDMAPEAGLMGPLPGMEEMTPIPGEQGGIDPLTAAGGVAALLASIYGSSKYMSRPGTTSPMQTPVPQQPGKVLALPAPSSENRPPVERDAGAGEKYAKQQQQEAGAENQKRADDAAAEAEYERKRPYLEGQAKREANAAAKKKSLREKAVEAGAASRKAQRAKNAKRAVRRVK